MIHPEMAGVKKADIKVQIAKKFKVQEDRISVFGIKAKYGGGRSTGFVSVYEDMDARRKYDTKTQLFRVSITDNTSNASLRNLIVQNGAFFLFFSFCFLILNLYYFNRTKLTRELRSSHASWPRSSKARERESRVLPSPRSSPVRRRSEQSPRTLRIDTATPAASAVHAQGAHALPDQRGSRPSLDDTPRIRFSYSFSLIFLKQG